MTSNQLIDREKYDEQSKHYSNQSINRAVKCARDEHTLNRWWGSHPTVHSGWRVPAPRHTLLPFRISQWVPWQCPEKYEKRKTGLEKQDLTEVMQSVNQSMQGTLTAVMGVVPFSICWYCCSALANSSGRDSASPSFLSSIMRSIFRLFHPYKDVYDE